MSVAIRKNCNYFSSPAHVAFNVQRGIFETRSGGRLIAVNEDWLRGFVTALEYEAGQATPAILQRCGEFFGKRLAQRFDKELSDYAQVPLRDRSMNEFIRLLDDMWTSYGMGKLEIDWTHAENFISMRLRASPMQDIGPSGHVGDDLFCGVLSGFFGHFSEAPIEILQTGDERLGDRDGTTFVIGSPDFVRRARKLKNEGSRHRDLVAQLGA
ncbi:MAG: hypothetical protein AAGD10_07185 [Myxococcota bacterium]